MRPGRDRASRWAPLVTALRERGYSPVAFDAPGHGRSGGRTVTVLEYEEAARLLQAAHGHFEAVVSHSFGSLAAFWALRHTVTADRLISVAGVGEVTFTVDSFAAALRLAPEPAAEFRRQVERRLLPGETRLWSRFSARHRTREITVPMLLIHDERDRVVPPAQTERVAEAYPTQADVLITRGLGHGRILGAPQTVAAVLDFLAATAGPPASGRTADAAGPPAPAAAEPAPPGSPGGAVAPAGPPPPEPAASGPGSSAAQRVG